MANRHVKKMDNLIWGTASGFFNSVSAGSTGILFATSGTLPTTLLRLRGEVLYTLEGASAPGQLIRCTMGIIKVPEGTGTTVLWEPVADSNAPWIWYDQAFLNYTEYVIDVVGSTEAASKRSVVDNKAMRRLRPDEELQIVLENTTIDSAGTCNVPYSIRFLLGF